MTVSLITVTSLILWGLLGHCLILSFTVLNKPMTILHFKTTLITVLQHRFPLLSKILLWKATAEASPDCQRHPQHKNVQNQGPEFQGRNPVHLRTLEIKMTFCHSTLPGIFPLKREAIWRSLQSSSCWWGRPRPETHQLSERSQEQSGGGQTSSLPLGVNFCWPSSPHSGWQHAPQNKKCFYI